MRETVGDRYPFAAPILVSASTFGQLFAAPSVSIPVPVLDRDGERNHA
ncbi:MAG: hypothetical protein RQ833_10405 [Sphingomonadaceae bacterium]|nr:hypothetical protein [Sphingomonadaceae bacterium]